MRAIPFAGISPFAHLSGRLSKRGASAESREKDDGNARKAEEEDTADENEDPPPVRDQDEDDADDREKKVDDLDDEDKAKKSRKAKKAKKTASDDEDEDADDDKRRDDDDGDREDDNDAKARAIRARERGRIKAILLSEPAKLNPAAAAHLATGTSMSRRQAIEMLAAMQSGSAASANGDQLRNRMTREAPPAIGAGDARASASLAEKIVMAGKKRRGEI